MFNAVNYRVVNAYYFWLAHTFVPLIKSDISMFLYLSGADNYVGHEWVKIILGLKLRRQSRLILAAERHIGSQSRIKCLLFLN